MTNSATFSARPGLRARTIRPRRRSESLEGLRGEDSIAELCRREGIAQKPYYRWSKDFLEAGKKRLAGDTARAATSDEVHDLRSEATALKEVVADLTLENRLLKKKRDGGWGGRRMRYPAAEKLEIIRLVEQSHLPVRRSLEQIGIPSSTFYRWCDLYQTGAPEALDDRRSSHWPSTNLSSHPVNWRCALPMPRATSRRKARCIACSRPTTCHQSGLHRDEGRRRVQGQDDGAEPALAT